MKFSSVLIELQGLPESDQQKCREHNEVVLRLGTEIENADKAAGELCGHSQRSFQDLEVEAQKLRSRIHNLHQRMVALAEARTEILVSFQAGLHCAVEIATKAFQ